METPTRDLALLMRDRDDAGAVAALLDAGADPNGELGDLATTPLIEAVSYGRLASAQALLARGGDLARTVTSEWKRPSALGLIRAAPFNPLSYVVALLMQLTRLSALPEGARIIRAEEQCSSKAMARLLVKHGADPMHFDADLRPAATGADLIPPQELSAEDFNHLSAPRAGRENPEPCTNPFYIEQIRTGRSGYAAGRHYLGAAHENIGGDPVWSFARFGQSATRLPDGRLVLIAGEHEDHYDPDFHIYNDVTVLDGKGGVEHFLYPKLHFPPTDFHTATLEGEAIWIVGSLGYQGRRDASRTQVLRLDLADMSVNPVQTGGDVPPWLSHHEALLEGREIFVRGGKIEPEYQDNPHRYALNLDTLTWRRLLG